MYMDDLTPVIECSVSGQKLPFYLDTGASGTNLFPAYYKRFHNSAKDWTKEQAHIFGAGGVVPREVSIQPELPLGVGDKTVVLRNVKIYDSDAIPPPTISMAISARIYFKGLTASGWISMLCCFVWATPLRHS
jgi:hypothetical protein